MEVGEPLGRERSPDTEKAAIRKRDWIAVNRAALEAAERARGSRSFLYVHYLDVHDHRSRGLSYADAVMLVDRALGRLMEGLAARDFLDKAVVVVTSDHGERLGEDHRVRGQHFARHGHFGNPSFDEQLLIPLLVAPPVFEDTTRLIRTQDLFGLLLDVASVDGGPTSKDLEPDELFVGERFFRTYRRGRWKTMVRRSDGMTLVYDLENDPGEMRNLAPRGRAVAASHRRRIDELSGGLAVDEAPQDELSEEDRMRLRELGYLQEPE